MTTVVNIRDEACDVYVGRPSVWGNPFGHRRHGGDRGIVPVPTREDAIQMFEDWLLGRRWADLLTEKRAEILRRLPELKGKRLGCWCHPEACHAEVLARMAEEIDPRSYNLALERAALLVCPSPHVEEERDCGDVAKQIRGLKMEEGT